MNPSLSATAPDILSIAWALGHRSESWLYDQIAHLKRHRVHVLTYAHLNPNEYPHAPVSFLPPRNAFLLRLRRLIRRTLGFKPRLLDGRERRCFRHLLEAGDLRLVQAHFAWVGSQVQEEVDRSGLPFVVWLYGSDVFRDGSASLLSGLLEPGRTFCCTSQALKTRAVELGCPAQSVHVVYPGIRVSSDTPTRAPSSGELRLFSVGRLTEVKAPLAFVHVARILKSRGVRFVWYHLGDGEMAPQVAEAAKSHDLGGILRFVGEVSHKEVLARLQSADILVHNAIVAPDGTREAFGVALAEAAAAGLPIVSVGLGGIPEIVRDGVSGYLVEEGDLEGMAAKIELLAEDAKLRTSMGVAGHAHALRSFELDKQVAKLDALYDELIAGQPAAARD